MATQAEKTKRAATMVGAVLLVLLLVISTASIAALRVELTKGLDAAGEPVGDKLFSLDAPNSLSTLRPPAFSQRSCGPVTVLDLTGILHGPITVGDGFGIEFSQDNPLAPCPVVNDMILWFDTGITLAQLAVSGVDSVSVVFGDDLPGTTLLRATVGFFKPGPAIDTPDPTGRGTRISVATCTPIFQDITEEIPYNRTLCLDEFVFMGMNPDFTFGFVLTGDQAGAHAFPPALTSFVVDFSMFGTPPNDTIASADLFDVFSPITFISGVAWLTFIGTAVAAWWIAPGTTFGLPQSKKGGR